MEGVFERALGDILARVSASVPRIAVAFSGGLDSAALLHLADGYAQDKRIELFAFHVHHGLSRNADEWLAHCERECGRLGIRFDARRVDVHASGRDSIEQAARVCRYAALGELCRLHGVPLLLTAHHQDDQAETVLLQLLRGAGVAGLSGMASAAEAPGLLGDVTPVLARPLLGLTRTELEEFASRHGIDHIEDESNDDLRYSRNALRHKVMPALDAYFPGYEQCVVRMSQHAQSAQRLLDELAAQDMKDCADGDSMDIARLGTLGIDRQDNLLRYWFAQHRVRMPSTAWMEELRSQLFCAREDAQVRVVHPDCEVRRHRGRAFIIPRVVETDTGSPQCTFRWQGQPIIHFPEFGGSLHFCPAGEGVGEDWLAQQEMTLRHRQGGEKLRAAPGRPSRTLKHHYQALDIPVWERQRLPVVLAAGRLLYAAGIGLNWKDLPPDGGRPIQLHWKKDIV